MKKNKIVSQNANPTKEKISALTVIIFVCLIIYCLFLLFLLGWGFINSFKTRIQYYENPFSVFSFGKWTFSNYEKALSDFYVDASAGKVYFPELFLNGFLYAFGCAIANTIVPCLTAYVCARFKFKFSKVMYLVVIFAMIIPIVGSTPSQIKMARVFGLYDHIWGSWIMSANFLGLYFIIFYNFFKGLPEEYTEAAKIDGAGNNRILWKVLFPMCIPLFSTVVLLYFITYWNNHTSPQLFLPSYPTIGFGVYYVATDGSFGYSVPNVLAVAFLVIIPVLTLFAIFHKKMLGNITMGGLKG